ncbi:MAG: hypothetical protein AB1817_07130 [Chloroflexota bacterium]
MTNKTKINLGLDIGMTTALVLMQVPQATGVELHRMAGIALGVGVIAHLILHGKEIAAKFKSSGKPLSSSAQFNLLINVLMVFFFTLTVVSGAQNSPMPLPGTVVAPGAFAWHAIHNLSARVTLLAVIAHLILHRKAIAHAMKRPAALRYRAIPEQ